MIHSKKNKSLIHPISLLFFLVLVVFACTPKVEPTAPPNIVWIVLEDMSPQFIGAYGNDAARTPVMDSLINAGTKFNAAFSTGTVCSPSRYTIITGTRTNEYGTGHHRSNFPIPDSVIPFPTFLRDSGYHTSNNSKRDYSTSARWRITQEAWVESSAQAGWWNREKGQPFFSVFNFNNCHQSRTFTNPYDDYKKRILDTLPPDEIITDEDIILPDFYKDTPELRKELARTYNALKKTDYEIDTLMDLLRRDALVESTIIFIYSDHGGGALRTKGIGSALGHQVPMAVIFPEKYEYLNPFKNHPSTDQPMTFEDLGPTVLSLAGLDAPGYMKGRPFLGKKQKAREFAFASADRCAEGMDLTRSVSDGRYFYTRNFYPSQPQITWMKYFDYAKTRQLSRQYLSENQLDETQKMLFEPRSKELLYDLQNDTWQTNNLTDSSGYQEILGELRIALDNELQSIKDVHFLPEYALDSIAKIMTPYEYKKSGAFDFPRIYEVAKLTGDGTESIEKQLSALKNEDPIIRYWAAIGLSSQEKETLPGYQKLLEEVLQDDFPPVQIIVASILYEMFDSDEGFKVLEKYLFHSNEFLAVQAIQEIIYLEPQKAKVFLEDVKTLRTRKIPGNLSESVDIYLYLFDGKELYYAHHW
ncbi:sulfatase [Fulvivirga sp. M361]|uniref:sulfatase family protein n=1 Tax=Fulvivirga sp. M361 TaxID=2594266 RepID=UPI00117B9A05|nr:sulfatase [Fulvivirga sp. M361]TRX48413.1 sulfatase [Fulvivirga sp. M361]